MRIVRISVQDEIKYGALEGDVIRGFRGSPFSQQEDCAGSFEPDGSSYKLSEVKLLAPCLPSKIICLGLNYQLHVEEVKDKTHLSVPKVPLTFLKPPTTIIGPEDNIVLPPPPRHVDYEGELTIVIGKKAKNVTEDQAREYILGYTCLNDVSERISQNGDGQWTRGKGYDTFAPLGPCIQTEIDPDDLKVETYLNGELRQSGTTKDLIFGIPHLISFISKVMTLLPGDIIATGTPSGIGEMKPGDTVEVKIENIGTLRNFVVEQS